MNCTRPARPEIKGATGQCIDLPADRRGRDLIGELRQAARGDVELQGTVSATARPVKREMWRLDPRW